MSIFQNLIEIIEKKITDIKIILNSSILDKKSKLRSHFEKNNNLAIIPCYNDTEITLILDRYGIDYHLYADDTQLYISCKPNEIDKAICSMQTCIKEVKKWMQNQNLKMNEDKTECIVISSNHTSKLIKCTNITIDGHTIPISHTVKNIGIYLTHLLNEAAHYNHLPKCFPPTKKYCKNKKCIRQTIP